MRHPNPNKVKFLRELKEGEQPVPHHVQYELRYEQERLINAYFDMYRFTASADAINEVYKKMHAKYSDLLLLASSYGIDVSPYRVPNPR